MKIKPTITRLYNLRNRQNSSSNSIESSSDENLHNAISMSLQQDSCPTLTDRNNTNCPVSKEIGLSNDRYQLLNFQNDTDNSSPDIKKGKDAVASKVIARVTLDKL